MTDFFVSYKREDEARGGRLVQTLESVELNVWKNRERPRAIAWPASSQPRAVAAVGVAAYACEDGACGVTGEAVCKLEERQILTSETYGGSK